MMKTSPSYLDHTFIALDDPSRRAIVQRLLEGETRVTARAHPFALSLNAVSRHSRIFERAKLVQCQRAGREHLISLNLEPLDQAATWIEAQRAIWAARLDVFDRVLKAGDSAVSTAPYGKDDLDERSHSGHGPCHPPLPCRTGAGLRCLARPGADR